MMPPRLKGRYRLRKGELKRLFLSSGMTLTQFADKLDMSLNGLKQWLNEECESEANYSRILDAAKRLHVKPSAIAEGVPESEEQLEAMPPEDSTGEFRYRSYKYESIEQLREIVRATCRALNLPEHIVTINDGGPGSIVVELVGPPWAIDRLIEGALNGELAAFDIDSVALLQDGSRGERQRRIESTGRPIAWLRGADGTWGEDAGGGEGERLLGGEWVSTALPAPIVDEAGGAVATTVTNHPTERVLGDSPEPLPTRIDLGQLSPTSRPREDQLVIGPSWGRRTESEERSEVPAETKVPVMGGRFAREDRLSPPMGVLAGQFAELLASVPEGDRQGLIEAFIRQARELTAAVESDRQRVTSGTG